MVICVIYDPHIIKNCALLSHRRAVAELSVFCKDHRGTSELSFIMPQFLKPVREIQQTVASHKITIELRSSGRSLFHRTFVPRVRTLGIGCHQV